MAFHLKSTAAKLFHQGSSDSPAKMVVGKVLTDQQSQTVQGGGSGTTPKKPYVKKGGKATGSMKDYAIGSQERADEYTARGWAQDSTTKVKKKKVEKVADITPEKKVTVEAKAPAPAPAPAPEAKPTKSEKITEKADTKVDKITTRGDKKVARITKRKDNKEARVAGRAANKEARVAGRAAKKSARIEKRSKVKAARAL